MQQDRSCARFHLHLVTRRGHMPLELKTLSPLANGTGTPQGSACDVYLPLAPLAADILSFSELGRPPASRGAAKPPDLSVSLKVGKVDLRNPQARSGWRPGTGGKAGPADETDVHRRMEAVPFACPARGDTVERILVSLF